MSQACYICNRNDWGSAVPVTQFPADHPLVISLTSEISGMGGTDYKEILHFRVCIDCRPKVEDRIINFLKK